ncbi:MAG TPA: RidA family protein [Stellaceae bacterium]|nr:RidA family protein [Stellaceae bacterium]
MSDTVQPLLPVAIPYSRARFARGMRAGRWLFASGLSGTDFVNGLAPDVAQAAHPLDGPPQAKREAQRLYANLAAVLEAGGAAFADVCRLDQYYTTPAAVPPYHETRSAVFAGRIPPSTSILQQRFLYAGQQIEALAVAAVPGSGFRATHMDFPPGYAIASSSGYSPALACGDFRFIPGVTAEARVAAEGPVDPEARRAYGLWKGTPVKLEAEFVIERKLKPSLAAAGATLDSVVKAQVYLRDPDDVPAFNEVWLGHFAAPPATTIISTSTPGFTLAELRIEINTIALARDGATQRQSVAGDAAPLFTGHVAAVRAGDLLFLSGLMGLEHGGLAAAARPDPRQPFFGIPVKAELAAILKQAEAVCRNAGTSLAHAVRIQQFHTDLADLPATLEVWHEALAGAPLPLSAVEVAWLPVPGARLLVDLWVHAP